MEERREGMEWIRGTLERIDARTEAMDSRLRSVEQKVNNGLSEKVTETNMTVKVLEQEQAKIKLFVEKVESDRARRQRMISTTLKIIGVIAAIAGSTAAIVRLIG